MKVPDKIYIQDYNIPEYGLSNLYSVERVENDAVHSIEYIRKDALLEWAKKKQYESLTIVADNFWQEVIDKLNEM